MTVQNLHFISHERDIIDKRVEWLNNSEVNRYLGSEPTTKEKQERWFNDYERDNTKQFFTIKVINQPIGVVGLSHIDQKNKKADVFIMIGEVGFWGRGLGRQSLIYIQQYATKKLGLNSLYLTVDRNNSPAIAAYQAVDFKVVDDKYDKQELYMEWWKS